MNFCFLSFFWSEIVCSFAFQFETFSISSSDPKPIFYLFKIKVKKVNPPYPSLSKENITSSRRGFLQMLNKTKDFFSAIFHFNLVIKLNPKKFRKFYSLPSSVDLHPITVFAPSPKLLFEYKARETSHNSWAHT